MKLYLNEPEKKKEIKTEKFIVETIPVKRPELEFSLVADDSNGNRDGLIQSGESAEFTLKMRNRGEGGILEGKAMLINTNDSKEIFIENGTHAFTLEPGKTDVAKFTFKTEKPAKAEDLLKQKLSVSIYDYKLKYSAEFDIPFEKAAKCSFENTDSTAFLEKETILFSASDLSSKIGTITSAGNVKVVGKCGNALLLNSGMWVQNSDTKPASDKIEAKIEEIYPIKMPKLVFDKTPLITDRNTTKINFEIDTKEAKDIFVFLNNKKIFYKRIENKSGNETLSVDVEMTKKYNRISVVITGFDAKTTTASKYVTFTKGEEKNGEEDYDE